jgi:hypothetical protein
LFRRSTSTALAQRVRELRGWLLESDDWMQFFRSRDVLKRFARCMS